jgi:hypothetical protein
VPLCAYCPSACNLASAFSHSAYKLSVPLCANCQSACNLASAFSHSAYQLSVPLCAYCQSACNLASAFSHSAYQLFVPLCAYCPSACNLASAFSHSAYQLFVLLCVYCHSAGILMPAFFHSTHQLPSYAHCCPPICLHSPSHSASRLYEKALSHIAALWLSEYPRHLCASVLSQSKAVSHFKLGLHTPRLYVPHALCYILIYTGLSHAVFTYILFSVPHSFIIWAYKLTDYL